MNMGRKAPPKLPKHPTWEDVEKSFKGRKKGRKK